MAIVVAALFHHPHGTPTPSPTPIPPADPAVTQIARRQFVAWQAGQIDRADYTASLNAQTPDSKVQESSATLGALGALSGVQYLGPRDSDYDDLPPGVHVYLYQMLCTNGSIFEQITLDPSDKVAGIIFSDTAPTPAP